MKRKAKKRDMFNLNDDEDVIGDGALALTDNRIDDFSDEDESLGMFTFCCAPSRRLSQKQMIRTLVNDAKWTNKKTSSRNQK